MRFSKALFPFLILLGVSTGEVRGQASPSPALLVGEKNAGNLSIVDPATLQIVARIPANRQPHEVVTIGNRAYVSNAGALSITVIDLATRVQLPGIEMGALGAVHGLWVSGGKLYFANEGARTIGRYDPATQKIDWVLGTGQPRSHLLIVSQDGNRIYTTNGGAGTVSIIERPGTQQRQGGGGGEWAISVIPAGRGVEGLDVSPDGRELWAINVQDKTITVVDIATRAVVATLPVVSSYSNRLRFTPNGRHVLVTDFRGTDLMIYDVATRREIKRIDVGGGSEGVLVAPDGLRAYVAVSGTNRLAVIDISTLSKVAEVPGLQNPDGMAWYVAP